MDRVAERIQSIAPECKVSCAFLELTTPDIHQVADEFVQSGVTQIAVLPMFLGMGRHAREDLPQLMIELRSKHQNVDFVLRTSVGEEPSVVEHLAQLALAGVTATTRRVGVNE